MGKRSKKVRNGYVTAVRELWEETGLTVSPERFDRPRWRRDATYRYRGKRRLQHEQILTVWLAGRGEVIDTSRRDAFEQEDCFGSRWWPVSEIVASDEAFYPSRLPMLLPRFLAGEVIAEPSFERWS
ncbi:MAG: NUDIX domain-containing protein [Nocardioidaceae bacterium]